ELKLPQRAVDQKGPFRESLPRLFFFHIPGSSLIGASPFTKPLKNPVITHSPLYQKAHFFSVHTFDISGHKDRIGQNITSPV
ncbi:MAG: hypothetical protein KAT94_04295, partial [Candidatus Aenigmarchaeota archaeon]|nr:hypothetical protein [Candidatus Aenigmarchaeota archaeon]